MGVGGQFFFPEIQPDLVCELLSLMAYATPPFFGSPPPGARERGQRSLHLNYKVNFTGPRSAVGNVSGYKCVSDCRSRGREFDPSQVPYFRGD